jgi:diphthamide biosynthesis methyltransferase
MPLFIIGLGLGDEKDVTVKGAEAIAKCDRVFLEAYTSVLGVSAAALVRAIMVVRVWLRHWRCQGARMSARNMTCLIV